MFPNKMRISEKATKELIRIQGQTGLTVNITARAAFLQSIERGDLMEDDFMVDNSGRELDKSTWLGDIELFAQLLIREKYPKLEDFSSAWNFHVERGASLVF